MSTFRRTIPVCIPARWAAKRFPGKLLEPFGNGTVLSHSVATATAAAVGPVCVLAADERIEKEALRVGVTVHRIDQDCRNGSERIAVALNSGLLGKPMPEIVVNLQGDAVGLPPEAIAACVRSLLDDPEATLATCAVRGTLGEHNGRTTVTRSGNRALAFSRHPLPPETGEQDHRLGDQPNEQLLLHLGVYAYRVPALLEIASSEPGLLELEESLEQLRWLERNHRIALSILDRDVSSAHAIDYPEDLSGSPSPHSHSNASSDHLP